MEGGHAICVERLLRAGADPTEPLHWAIESGYPKCAWRLLEAGADATQTNGDGQKAKEAAYQYAQDHADDFCNEDLLHLFVAYDKHALLAGLHPIHGPLVAIKGPQEETMAAVDGASSLKGATPA